MCDAKAMGNGEEVSRLGLDLVGWRNLMVLLRGWANSREGWLEETTWDFLVLTYEKSMMVQYFGNITLHISK